MDGTRPACNDDLMPEPPPGFSETPAPDFDLFEDFDEAEEERAMAEAEQAIREGRVISNEAMLRWIRSWNTADELPPPRCGQ